MPLSTSEARGLLRSAYAGQPLATRLHVGGRFRTCPFLRVLSHVPAGARLLDIGAGHGAFALLAAETGARLVVAVEPDLRKARAWFRHPRMRFVAGYDTALRGPFDVVTMCDVLYRVPLAEWDALLARVHALLAPGGLFLLKDLDPGHRVKHAWNRLQERAVDAVGLTLGPAFAYESREAVRARLERAAFVDVHAEDIGAGYPHAHILHLAHRPA